jgi:plastocyanin
MASLRCYRGGWPVTAALALVLGGLASSASAAAPGSAELDAEGPVALAAGGGNDVVAMRDFSFAPKRVEIDAGDRVRWRNEGVEPHTASEKGGGFNTGRLDAGESKSIAFHSEGTFKYICRLHPQMKGTVEVRASEERQGSGGVDPTGDTGSTPTTDDGSTGFSDPSTGFSDSSSTDSSGSLPSTGEDEAPLIALGAGLVALGLLAGAAAAWWEWAD